MRQFHNIFPVVLAVVMGVGSAYHTFNPAYQDLTAEKFKAHEQEVSDAKKEDINTTLTTPQPSAQTTEMTYVRRIHNWWNSKNPPS
ncbi:hypothetical protein VTO42DRAFT_6697 [Malbranchea cinnamomea]